MPVFLNSPEDMVAAYSFLKFVEMGKIIVLAINYRIDIKVWNIPHKMFRNNNLCNKGPQLLEMLVAINTLLSLINALGHIISKLVTV